MKKSKGMRKHIRKLKAKQRKKLVNLLPTERDVFNIIVRYIKNIHRPPTLREIAKLMRWQHTRAAQIVNQLVDKKYIIKDAEASRGIRLNTDFYEVTIKRRKGRA
ncbi:MAG: hypothetical protein GF375_03500 [Candidatus Omnitrophica bacterium]|nr:hypothetical protein [Candidatus Omnitrophota bacterium]